MKLYKMNSGDGSSVATRRTRQQFLKYCVNLIEKQNKSTQNDNTKRKTVELEERKFFKRI